MKLRKIIIMALCLSLVMTCGVFLAACNKGGGEGGGDTYVPRNSNQWFTEAELAKKRIVRSSRSHGTQRRYEF